MTGSRRQHPAAGWVLMEALVAMVFLSIAVVALNRGFAEAVLTRAIARDYTQARFFLEQVVGELELKPVHEDGASGKGNFGKEHPRFSYTWSVAKTDVTPPSIPPTLPPQMQAIAQNFEPPIAYLGKISVRVEWTRAGRAYSAELDTTIAPGALRVQEDDTVAVPF